MALCFHVKLFLHMKSKLITVLLCTFAFLLSLEVISWLLLSADVKPQVVRNQPHVIWNRDGIAPHLSDQNRIGEVLRNYVAWEEKHPEIQKPFEVDMDLRIERARYVHKGVKTGQGVFKGFDTLNADINDDFELYGANSGKLKYSIHYETDSFGRRKTGYENKANAKYNLIFVGCSFTFGEGVPTNSTFPAIVGKLIPQARTYNLGVPGSSPALRLLALKNNKKLLKDIDPEIPTYIIFTFIDDHIRRVIGTSLQIQNLPNQYEEAPDFYLENNKLMMHPDYYQRFKYLRKLNKLYSYTNFAKVTRLEFPMVSDYHYELLAKIISEMKNEIKTVLPETREIYLAAFPEQNYYVQALRPYLMKEGVKTLDYAGINFPTLMGRHFHLEHDIHPSAKTYEMYGHLLVSDLKKDLDF